MLRTFLVIAACLLLSPKPALPASCVDGGCHQGISSARYVHGPVAVERFGQKGCVLCHVPAGPACTDARGGAFTLKSDPKQICTGCHDAGNGTRHTGTQGACLSCHDPHGSDSSAHFLRKG